MAVRTDTGSDYVAAVQAEIRAQLARRKISQKQLAERAGVTSNAVTKWLNGDRLDLQTLCLISEVINVSVLSLISDAEDNREDLRSASNRCTARSTHDDATWLALLADAEPAVAGAA